MTQSEVIKAELAARWMAYRPQGETSRHIRDVSIGMIIGPTCVGKSTVIKEVVALDPEFSNPGGFTDRKLRPSDAKSYRQLRTDEESLGEFLEAVKRGEPVQYMVYDTGHIYGSEVRDYQTPFSVLDTVFRSVDNLRNVGFKSTTPIALSADPDQYVRQLRARFGNDFSSEEVTVRLNEAVMSLEWALEQKDDINWVLNRPDEADQAAREVIGLVRGYFEPLKSRRLSGERLLKRIKDIKN
ncbi:MAG TPA: hypothetical protein VFJ84_02950 [Candidatus Saccharimonadales bacterium]|nr:hypothetical protein [Candidatus Saccharimonadales bacterium]